MTPSITEALDESAVISGFRATGARVTELTRQSLLYRWLTEEPEPDVIVIDLRRTYTVGPLIDTLEWTAAKLTPYWRESRLHHWLDRCGSLFSQAAETRLGRLASRVLEPPEAPGGQSDQMDGSTESGEEF